MENSMIDLVARTIDVPPEELVEWLESRQKVEHQEKPPLSPWLSRKAAAEYASVSTDTIDNWCAAGLIEKSKLNDSRPGAVLILRDSLEKYRVLSDGGEWYLKRIFFSYSIAEQSVNLLVRHRSAGVLQYPAKGILSSRSQVPHTLP